MTSDVTSRRHSYDDEDVLHQGTKAPLARFTHIANVVGTGNSVKDALATKAGTQTADKPEGLYSRLLNQDREAGYIRIEHVASDGEIDEFEHGILVPLGGLSDEDSSREADESEYFPSMALGDLSDRDGFMANPARVRRRLATECPQASRGHVRWRHVRWRHVEWRRPDESSEQRRHGASTELQVEGPS